MFYSLKSGVKLNYILCGNGNGKPLLFLHDYAETYEYLKEYKIIILDTRDFQHDSYDEDIKEFINHLNFNNIYIIGEKYEMLNHFKSFDIIDTNFILINENKPSNELLDNKWENDNKNYLNLYELNLSEIKDINKYVLMNVLYEDNHILAVNKPCGLLSQKEKESEIDILDVYKLYLKNKYKKTGNVYLGLVQRLDRNVSGVMVLSKTSKAHERLNQNRPEKCYRALVHGTLENKKDTLINYISKDEKRRIAYEDKNGKKAILHYEVIDENNEFSLLNVYIETGRFHQIRYQLSMINHPILNDTKYSNFEALNNDLGLEAFSVKFIHPVKKIEMEFNIISRLKI